MAISKSIILDDRKTLDIFCAPIPKAIDAAKEFIRVLNTTKVINFYPRPTFTRAEGDEKLALISQKSHEYEIYIFQTETGLRCEANKEYLAADVYTKDIYEALSKETKFENIGRQLF